MERPPEVCPLQCGFPSRERERVCQQWATKTRTSHCLGLNIEVTALNEALIALILISYLS